MIQEESELVNRNEDGKVIPNDKKLKELKTLWCIRPIMALSRQSLLVNSLTWWGGGENKEQERENLWVIIKTVKSPNSCCHKHNRLYLHNYINLLTINIS